MQEIWKDIKDYEGLYMVSNKGRIKSLYRNKEIILKPAHTDNGYLMIGLYKNGHRKPTNIHRLVANAFLIPIPGKIQVNHIDGNKDKNEVSNLEWCTCQENIIHAHKKGLSKVVTGEKVGTSKLTIEEVKSIKALKGKGVSQKSIAKMFNVSQAQVWKIHTNKCWANI